MGKRGGKEARQAFHFQNKVPLSLSFSLNEIGLITPKVNFCQDRKKPAYLIFS